MDVPVDGEPGVTVDYPARWRATSTVRAVAPPMRPDPDLMANQEGDTAALRHARAIAARDLAADSPEWEPAEYAPCTRCGEPTLRHDVHGGCPPTSDDGDAGPRNTS